MFEGIPRARLSFATQVKVGKVNCIMLDTFCPAWTALDRGTDSQYPRMSKIVVFTTFVFSLQKALAKGELAL